MHHDHDIISHRSWNHCSAKRRNPLSREGLPFHAPKYPCNPTTHSRRRPSAPKGTRKVAFEHRSFAETIFTESIDRDESGGPAYGYEVCVRYTYNCSATFKGLLAPVKGCRGSLVLVLALIDRLCADTRQAHEYSMCACDVNQRIHAIWRLCVSGGTASDHAPQGVDGA